MMFWSVLIALPMALAVQKGDTAVRRLNIRFSSQAAADLAETTITRSHWKGVAVFFANYFVLTTVFLFAGVALLGVIDGLRHGQEVRGASIFLQCLPIVGVATWLAKDKGKKGPALLAAGFLAAYVAGGVLGVPWAVVLLLLILGALAWSFYELRG